MDNEIKKGGLEQSADNNTHTGQPVTVDLRKVAQSGSSESSLDLIRVGSDETAIVPFTYQTTLVALHYCNEREISGYVLCNNEGCLLCRIGRKKDERYLLPVYTPAEKRVGILPVSPSLRPFSLLAQLHPILQAENPVVVFLSRDGMKYTVSTRELKPDMDAGESEIKTFLENFNAGNVNLSSIYPRVDNTQLAMISEIERMMKLKGINVDNNTAA